MIGSGVLPLEEAVVTTGGGGAEVGGRAGVGGGFGEVTAGQGTNTKTG